MSRRSHIFAKKKVGREYNSLDFSKHISHDVFDFEQSSLRVFKENCNSLFCLKIIHKIKFLKKKQRMVNYCNSSNQVQLFDDILQTLLL